MALDQPKARAAGKSILNADVRIGFRLRIRRLLLGMSRRTLGDAVGVTFQQIEKYERGLNRISASRLSAISNVLNVPISFFFYEFEASDAAMEGAPRADAPSVEYLRSPERDAVDLVTFYCRIQDAPTRRHIFDLVKCIAEEYR